MPGPNHKLEIRKFEKSITALSDALAHLGKGTSLKDLIMIIKNPGWTTPAELLYATSIVDTMMAQVETMERLQTNLLRASRMVGAEIRGDVQMQEQEAVAK